MTHSEMEALTKDIIADILSRISVKHLLVCKCVSHAWNDLISNDLFVKLYRERSQRVGAEQRVVYSRSPNSPHTADFDSFDREAPFVPPLLHAHDLGSIVVGSCDGLLCLCELARCYTRFALCNPATQLYNILPWAPFEGNLELRDEYMLYCGFGYDSISNDYMVLRIAQTSEDPSDYFRCDARVYSLSTNTWKKVADVPYCLFRLNVLGVHFNGSLHFLGSEMLEQPVPDKIVAFKLGDESYFSVPLPKFPQYLGPEERRHWLSVGVLDGCLSLVDNHCSEDHHYDVWVMKEYGVQKSWSKICRIEYPEPTMFNIGRQDLVPAGLRPISFSKNRKEIFFMVHSSHLVSYDLEKKTLQLVVNRDDQVVTWDMVVYQETLTSPLTGTVNDDDDDDDDEDIMKFPEDCMTDILLRSPVKSLIRFKSVSSWWYDLIRVRNFVTLHLEWSRKANSKLYIAYNDSSFALRHVEFDSFEGDTSLDHPFVGPEHTTIVVGASDGLLCLCDMTNIHYSYPFALYNPTTQSSNVLPDSVLERFSGQYDFFIGFGYDSTNNDYKVVKIAQPRDLNDDSRQFALVYSMNTNYWRLITTIPFHLKAYRPSGVYVNGVVHWVACSDSDKYHGNAIAGFDIVHEKCSLVPQPPALELPEHRRWRCLLDIGIVDGCLSQVCNYCSVRFHDVWVMKEYGVQSSWVKLFRIVDEEHIPLILRPIVFSRNKRELFLVAFCNFIVSYDVEEKKLRKCTFPDHIGQDAQIYEESLVSAGVGNVNPEQQGYHQ